MIYVTVEQHLLCFSHPRFSFLFARFPFSICSSLCPPRISSPLFPFPSANLLIQGIPEVGLSLTHLPLFIRAMNILPSFLPFLPSIKSKEFFRVNDNNRYLYRYFTGHGESRNSTFRKFEHRDRVDPIHRFPADNGRPSIGSTARLLY